jgi:hypothetical protein
MTTHTAITLDDEDAARKARAARRFEMLAELAETGMEVSRRIRTEVRALNAVETVEDLKIAPNSAELALAFGRVSRAVRQTLAMEARLEADEIRNAPDEDELRRRRWAAADEARRQWLEADTAKKRAARLERAARKVSVAMALADEDLADADELDELDALVEASDVEVMARVCADLGVERDVSAFGDEVGVEAVGSVIRSDAGALAASPLHHSRPSASNGCSPYGGGI